MRVARVARVALWLGLAACGRSCGCVEGETAYESLDGKVRLELVRKVHWTGGKLPGPMTAFAVRVHTEEPFDEAVECAHVELAEDEAGRLAAFRCKGTRPWTVLRLYGRARRLRECRAPVGVGDAPRFEGLQPLSASIHRILGCNRDESRRLFETLTRTIAELEGGPAAAQAVVTMADHPRPWGDDPWPGALAALDDAGRAGALAGVCRSLAGRVVTPSRYARAAERCPLDADGVGAGAVAQLSARLTQPRPSEGQLLPADALALDWSAAIASAKAPGPAGAAACAAVPSIDAFDSRDEQRHAAAAHVIATTGTRCPALVSSWMKQALCGEDLDCGDRLCSAAELAPALATWRAAAEAPPGASGVRPAPPAPPARRSILAAALALGALPRDTLVANERRHYTLQTTPGAPPCRTALAPGTPCTCDAPLESLACISRPEETEVELGECRVRIDDAGHRFFDVRSRCEVAGASCATGRYCCAGLECGSGPEPRCTVPVVDGGPR